MVLYADDESFTFMTPEGHALSAWITFSAYRDGDVTVAQVQALERTTDPFDELTYMLGANRTERPVLARRRSRTSLARSAWPRRSSRPRRLRRQATPVAVRPERPAQRDGATCPSPR